MISDGQLRWVQIYSSIGDVPPYHLSFDSKVSVCQQRLNDNNSETNRYEEPLTGLPPTPRCTECLRLMALHFEGNQ